MKNYYEILQVNENASTEIIEKAYKVLVKKYHPDLQKDIKVKEATSKKLKEIDESRPELEKEVAEEVNIEIKYEGYIKLEENQVEKFKKLENKKIDENLNYDNIKGLRIEAKQKLNKIKPMSIGQASRISGVSPADISVLLIYIETIKNKE